MRLESRLAPLTPLTFRAITDVRWSRQSEPTREMELDVTLLTLHDRYRSLDSLTYRARLTIRADPLSILFCTLFRALDQTSLMEGLPTDHTLFVGGEA